MSEDAAWLEQRRTGVGGSDVAAILGLSQYATAHSIWLDKLGRLTPEDEAEKPWLYWGHKLEPIIAHEYSERTGRRTTRMPLIRHAEKSHWIANIDRAVVEGERSPTGPFEVTRILECKTANPFVKGEWGEEGTDEVPAYYLTQVQWYLSVTGADVADLAVLIGGSDFRIYTIPRNNAVIAALRDAVDDFWIEHVLTKIAPSPQNYEDAKLIWPRQRAGEEKIIGPQAAIDCVELAEIAINKKRLEEREDILKTRIAEALGDAEVGTHGGEDFVTWKAQTADRVNVGLLQKEHPDIAALYTTTSETRVMRLKKPPKEIASAKPK